MTCALIQFGDKILAVQRSEHMKLPLKWEFAGGKIEPGESEVDCVTREVLEELNIHIEAKERLTPVIHTYPDFKIELIPFVVDYVSGDLKLKEHADYVLVEKEELCNLDWAEADLPILQEFTEL
ncbi:8-oxo-dGTP diphosphatase [Gelidibacter sediminis]|uniref:8-oxo-dGTP diphosphatase n=1 Tax=Gelidibacter sediminis TaxID=1608710 RepID=A0A4R7Q7Y7_9FLAO|nr:8-oxo-dGTP diphosphatase [Gelidibacter sediminis]